MKTLKDLFMSLSAGIFQSLPAQLGISKKALTMLIEEKRPKNLDYIDLSKRIADLAKEEPADIAKNYFADQITLNEAQKL